MSTAIVLEGVAFRHRDDHDLLHDVHLHLTPGFTGIVGANGTGKSTLLRLIAGQLAPTRGHVRREPRAARVVLCPQRVHALGADVRRLAQQTEGLGRRLTGLFALDSDSLQRWESLSPGERRRWQLAAVLARDPEVLLLDEPSNHLDDDSRRQLERALAGFRGIGIIVSHDRRLLQALTDTTIVVAEGTAQAWPGAYDHARAAWEAERQRVNMELERDRGRARTLARRLGDERRKKARIEANIGARSRIKGPRDRDGRSVNRRERAAKAAAKTARGVKVVGRASERADTVLDGRRYRGELGGAIHFDHQAPSRRPLLRLCVDELRAGTTRCAGRMALSIEPETRVWLRGPNGAGKSTLLRALHAASRLPAERLFHLPQAMTPDEIAQLMHGLKRARPEERGRVLQRVAALGVEPGPLLHSDDPSAGEARKLALAQGLAQPSWCLLLDEPTNHLDLPSIERLEQALVGYPGALVLVSHDERFAMACTSEQWQLDHEGLSRS